MTELTGSEKEAKKYGGGASAITVARFGLKEESLSGAQSELRSVLSIDHNTNIRFSTQKITVRCRFSFKILDGLCDEYQEERSNKIERILIKFITRLSIHWLTIGLLIGIIWKQ